MLQWKVFCPGISYASFLLCSMLDCFCVLIKDCGVWLWQVVSFPMSFPGMKSLPWGEFLLSLCLDGHNVNDDNLFLFSHLSQLLTSLHKYWFFSISLQFSVIFNFTVYMALNMYKTLFFLIAPKNEVFLPSEFTLLPVIYHAWGLDNSRAFFHLLYHLAHSGCHPSLVFLHIHHNLCRG